MAGSVYELCANPEHWRRPTVEIEIKLGPLVVDVPLCKECADLLLSHYDISPGTSGDPLSRLFNPRYDIVQ